MPEVDVRHKQEADGSREQGEITERQQPFEACKRVRHSCQGLPKLSASEDDAPVM